MDNHPDLNINIAFNTANAAFSEGGQHEVAAVFNRAQEALQEILSEWDGSDENQTRALRDTNGKSVGWIRVERPA
jgi:hypothetical protein